MPLKLIKPNRQFRLLAQINQLKIFTPSTRKADFFLLFVVFILTIVGLIMVYDASIVEANHQFQDKFYYLKYQGTYAVLGWIGLLIAGHVDYHVYKRFIKWMFLGNLFLLLLVLIPHIGLRIKGASRWLDLGFVTFQPSETMKTLIVLYLATWLEKKRTLQQFFAIVAVTAGLIIVEPDLGTTIVLISTAFIIYYVSGAPIMKFALATFYA